jgi:uncharacterized coiled-coil protein SlyX
MAPTKHASTFAWGTRVSCPKPGGCIGSIPLGALVYKKACKEKAQCRVCLAAGKQRDFVVPPGTSLDPTDYHRKSGTKVVTGGIPASVNGGGSSRKGDKTSSVGHVAAAELAAERARTAQLESLLKAQGVEVPEPTPLAPAEDLSKLKEELEVLKRWGAPTVELDKRISALEEKVAAKPTLHAVLGKITAAEAKAKKSAEHVLRMEEHLATANAKALAAAGDLAELYKQRDHLMVELASAKPPPAGHGNVMDTSFGGEFTKPDGLDEEDSGKWDKLVAEQRAQWDALRDQQKNLEAAFQAEVKVLTSKVAPGSAEASASTVGVPESGAVVPVTQDLEARAAKAELKKQQDADGNFKRLREEDAARIQSADRSNEYGDDAKLLLEKQLELARAAKVAKQQESAKAGADQE